MNPVDLENIIKIKNEIDILLKEIGKKEIIIAKKLEKNIKINNYYKLCMENVIENFHDVCKKIYK